MGLSVTKTKSGATLDDFVEASFWSSTAKLSLDAGTLISQKGTYRCYVKPRWGKVSMDSITNEAVQQWRAKLGATPSVKTGKPISDGYQRQVYWLLHQILAVAAEMGYLSKTPMPRTSGFRASQPTKPERFLDHDEITALADHAAGQKMFKATLPIGPDGADVPGCVLTQRGKRALIYVLAYGGFRIGEAFGLRLDDISWDHGEVAVDEQQDLAGGKCTYKHILKRSRSHRVTPLPGSVLELLYDYVATDIGLDNRSAILFPSRKDYFRVSVFHPAAVAARVAPMKPHDLRHTAASIWLDEGYSLDIIAKWLGDSLAVTEDTYTHLFKGRSKGDPRMSALDKKIREASGVPANVVRLNRL